MSQVCRDGQRVAGEAPPSPGPDPLPTSGAAAATTKTRAPSRTATKADSATTTAAGSPQVTIYTDGGASPNPGKGGYGVVLLYGKHRKELSAGFQRTTNNRMEILAAIAGLEVLREPCQVTLYSDSQYLVNAMTKGWVERWRRKGWMRTKKDAAKNPDLWDRLYLLCQRHTVSFKWVRGHASNVENNHCDRLATQARKLPDLAPDTGFEEDS